MSVSCSDTALPPTENGFVKVQDAALEAVLREACEKHFGGLAPSDLERITELNAAGKGIASLSGIECCSNLKSLNLRDNRITSIVPLHFLTALEDLDLYGNSVSELAPLTCLASLKKLDLRKNSVTDIVPLVRCTCRGTLRNGVVMLSGNPLSQDAIEIHFHILQARSIQVIATDF